MRRIAAAALDRISFWLMAFGGYLFNRSYSLNPASHEYLGPPPERIMAGWSIYQPSAEDETIAWMLSRTPLLGVGAFKVELADSVCPEMRFTIYRTTLGAQPSV